MRLATMERREVREPDGLTYFILVCFPVSGYGEHYKNAFTSEKSARARAREILRTAPHVDNIMLRRESVYLRTFDPITGEPTADISTSSPLETIKRGEVVKHDKR